MLKAWEYRNNDFVNDFMAYCTDDTGLQRNSRLLTLL